MPVVRIRHVLWLLGMIGGLVVVWYLWASRATPPGQPPLTPLSEDNLDKFKNDFDGAPDEARLVLLLSPT